MSADRIPLLLVPGLLCSTRLWEAQVDGLADIALPIVTQAQSEHDSLPAIATAILATAPHRFALAGLSFGGYVAMELLRQAPERVLGVALLDTSAKPDTPERIAARRDLIALAEKGRFLGVTDRLLPMLVHPDRLADAALVAAVKQMAADVGKDGFLRQQAAIMARPDSRPSLRRIGCPALLLCGREDLLTPPAEHEEMHGLIAGSRLVVLERCGHLSSMEAPEAVNAALRDWLGRLRP